MRTAAVIATCFLASSLRAQALPFTAGAGLAAPASVGVISENPATDVHSRTSDVEGGLIFRSTSTGSRYPGYPTDRRSHGGIDVIKTMELFKVATGHGRFNVSVTPFPPLGLPGTAIDNIPIVLLGQPNALDLNVDTKLNGGLSVGLAVAITPSLVLAARASLISASADVTAKDHDTSRELFSVSADAQIIASSIGLYLQLSKHLSLGAIAQPYAAFDVEITDFNSPELGLTKDKVPLPPINGARTFPQMGLGIAYAGGKAALLADLIYTRADSQVRTSPVEFVPKDPDVYDTVSARAGVLVSVSNEKQLVAGVRYEPAAKGDGGIGPDSKTGFTSVDYLPVALGYGELTPLYEVAAGLRTYFGEAVKRLDGNTRKSRKFYYYKWRFAGGVVYQTAERGIDADGEQPAAYYYRSVQVPVIVTYRF